MEYPVVAKIGRGTPAFDCPDIALGDKIKACNGQWLQGKSEAFVHELVSTLWVCGSCVETDLSAFEV
jgi:hypothetical protein